jgi:DNA-binding NtrC family response regulator
MVSDGEFREDLYFRIHVAPITVPPLRERREDIPSLIRRFTEMHRSAGVGGKLRFTPEAFAALTAYDYPGNVRELKNIIEHLAILHPDTTISPRHLARLLQHADVVEKLFASFATGKPLRDAITEFERKYIEKVLQSVEGHKTRTAHILGLSRKVLWEKLKRYKLNDLAN